ncbi:MAG TPA: PadR family transcriptional regulator [Bacillota bacterium]|nr:PadR family transcriptional regulator [Bacillota bacterium]
MGKVNKTKYAILGVLNYKPASGYDIKKFCDESIAHFWNENYGHIYPVLKQLEVDGWVTKTTEINAGKPPRNVYQITATGKKALHEWLLQPPEVPQARYEFLLKMFFSKEVPLEKVITRLNESLNFCKKILEEYLKIEQGIMQGIENQSQAGPDLPYWLSTVRYGIINMEGNIKWCTETIASLTEFKNKREEC